jgi:hypothetical protein
MIGYKCSQFNYDVNRFVAGLGKEWGEKSPADGAGSLELVGGTGFEPVTPAV